MRLLCTYAQMDIQTAVINERICLWTILLMPTVLFLVAQVQLPTSTCHRQTQHANAGRALSTLPKKLHICALHGHLGPADQQVRNTQLYEDHTQKDACARMITHTTLVSSLAHPSRHGPLVWM
jgi:hypothetical protein